MLSNLLSENGLIMVFRWIHFLAGATWLGLIYYLNFSNWSFNSQVHVSVKNELLSRHLPRVLAWFRWGALLTFISGAGMLTINFRYTGLVSWAITQNIYFVVGALLGVMMFFNSWLMILLNQKLIIDSALPPAQGPVGQKDAGKLASQILLISRTNILFSIPMVFFCVFGRNVSVGAPEHFSPGLLLFYIFFLILVLEVNALKGKLGPLATQKGVLACGVALLGILFAFIKILVSLS